jgi:hypothetical protein
MARIRTVKPEFFTSLTVAGLSVEARLTFIGLWTHVDDQGRCVDDPRLIKAAVWPLDDRISADIERDLRELTESSLILRYKVGERSYLCVRAWDEHQRINRPTKSRLPAPPDDPPPPASGQDASWRPAETPGERPENSLPASKSVRAHAQLTEDSLAERNREQGKEQGKEQGLATPPASLREAAAKRGTRIPDDFAVTAEMVAWARENAPQVNGSYETAKFVDYWRAKAGRDATKTDWIGTWRNWMRKAQEDTTRGGRGVTTGANRHTSQRHDNPFAEASA